MIEERVVSVTNEASVPFDADTVSLDAGSIIYKIAFLKGEISGFDRAIRLLEGSSSEDIKECLAMLREADELLELA